MKAAVIGTGRIASQHLACLRQLPGVQVAGVCDISPTIAEVAAERFAVPRWFTDHNRMLEELRPDVVHITTPPASHFALAMDALDRGSNVIVEKPITPLYDQLAPLRRKAEKVGRWLIEDHNYQFNPSVQKILRLIETGRFGEVVHVEAIYCLAMPSGSALADANAPVALPGGPIGHFTTHLAYLAYIFVGAHESVRTIWSKRDAASPVVHDEFRALIKAQRGTAVIGFSGNTQPDGLWLRVYGTRMQATANLFENRLTSDRLRSCPRPLQPLLNAWEQAHTIRRAAHQSLLGKLSGSPGVYQGLWELLARVYKALGASGRPPISLRQIDDVNRLVSDLTREELSL